MKLKELTKSLLIIASIGVLAACSTGRKPQGDQYASDGSAAMASDDAETSGAGDDDRINGSGRGNGQHLSSKRTYYFDFDSNIVRETDKPAIISNATNITGAVKTAMLQGHTDPRGSREYNIGLGERRAKAVADLLREHGVNPGQIRLVSYGSEKPAANGRSEEDYQLDRRVVLVYMK
jgi:peptidoglycan-associated lipoprotein